MDSPYTRHYKYESNYDYQIMDRVPIIINVNGRNFGRLTKRLDRPFDKSLINVFKNTLIQTIQSIDDAVFGFQYSDDFTFVLRNDFTTNQTSWYLNKIQDINSVVTSLVSTNFFKNVVLEDDLNELDGDGIFKTKVFALPSLTEVVNHLVWKQQLCYGDAIFRAAYSELTKEYGKAEANKLLLNTKLDDKIEFLKNDCNIDYESFYPKSYRLGVAAYKAPKIIKTQNEDIQKNKWITDSNLPSFLLDNNFLFNIIKSGHDVFRAERDLIISD